jgi:hypothetical protein
MQEKVGGKYRPLKCQAPSGRENDPNIPCGDHRNVKNSHGNRHNDNQSAFLHLPEKYAHSSRPAKIMIHRMADVLWASAVPIMLLSLK